MLFNLKELAFKALPPILRVLIITQQFKSSLQPKYHEFKLLWSWNRLNTRSNTSIWSNLRLGFKTPNSYFQISIKSSITTLGTSNLTSRMLTSSNSLYLLGRGRFRVKERWIFGAGLLILERECSNGSNSRLKWKWVCARYAPRFSLERAAFDQTKYIALTPKFIALKCIRKQNAPRST